MLQIVQASRPRVWEFNVRDYGAVGDGVVDDTAALQACAAAAAAASSDHRRHATIYMPRGQYLVSDTPFSFAGPVTPNIIGEGMYSTMIMVSASMGATDDVIYIHNTYSTTATTLAGGATAVAATGHLVSTAVPANGETVTIDTKVYTWQTTLTNVNGNVKIGASVTASLLNLLNAINLTGTAGTDYATAMTLHTTVTATASDMVVMDVAAKATGTGGNSIAVATTLANGHWATGAYYSGLRISEFTIIPVSGNPGRHGIFFDAGVFTMIKVAINRLTIRDLGATGTGRSIMCSATAGTGGGVADSTIRECWLECVEFTNAGDGISIRDNVFGCYRDGNCAIKFNMVSGAHGFHIDSNVIAAISGAIQCGGGTAPRITDNEIEGIAGGAGTHSHNAIIDLNASVAPGTLITHPLISGNSISSLTGNGDQVCLFLGPGDVENCEITGNRMSMFTGTKPITMNSTTLDTYIGGNHFVTAKFAYGTLIVTGVINNGETVTIAGKTYTWQTTLTNVDGNVKIGAGTQQSLNNLKAAINLEAGSGTVYAAATTLHTTVGATQTSSTSLLVTAKTEGLVGNSLAVADGMANASWVTGATLVNGQVANANGGVSRTFNPCSVTPGTNTQFAQVRGVRSLTSANLILYGNDRALFATPDAVRTVYLPFANSVPAGTEIEIYCGVVSVNTLTIALQGGDSFVGGTVTRLLNVDYTGTKCVSNGGSLWYYTGVALT